LTLYDDDGTSHELGTLAAPSGENANFYSMLSGYGNFHGRAVVESTNGQPIAAAVNLLNYNITGDALMLYNATSY
jgi:hypothetical protein